MAVTYAATVSRPLTRVKPCENGVAGHLYGLAKVHDSVVVCGSYTMDYPEEEGSNASHWTSFYLPLGALSETFPVGAYPFGPMDRVSEWKAHVDSLLVDIANWVNARSPIRFGLVGFEVNVADVLLKQYKRMVFGRNEATAFSGMTAAD